MPHQGGYVLTGTCVFRNLSGNQHIDSPGNHATYPPLCVQNVRCVPGSDVSASEAAFYGVPLATLDDVGGVIDVLIDQADEVDIAAKSHKIAYIVGRGSNGPQAGQPSLPRLRALLASARRAIVLADGINTVRYAETNTHLRLNSSVHVFHEQMEVWLCLNEFVL